MLDPFERGKAWFIYKKLEKEFIETTSYVALESTHANVWSEKFGELLVRTGDLIDSFFRLMIDSKSLDNQQEVKILRTTIAANRKSNPKWFPDIKHFRETFNPIFNLSDIEVDADYGLTSYGKLQPFKDFDKQTPSWWEAYNKVKHEIFEEIEKRATLENTINALASLFVLNILHKENQRYLVRYTDTIFVEYLQKGGIEKALEVSFIGTAHNFSNWKFVARTPIFLHIFRSDPDPSKIVGSYY